MTREHPHGGESDVPRFLPDRRSGTERRGGADRRRERRELYDLAVEHQRRAANQGARTERRVPGDRRRPSEAQYSWQDTLRIHGMLADPSTPVACPRCDGALLLGPPEPRDGMHTREVHCTGCRYSVAVVVETGLA